MAPPSIMMYTPSGRFETNMRICLSMSDFHPESWKPSWNVGTILTGLLSFMTSEESSTGTLRGITSAQRRALSQASHTFNAKESYFCELFPGDVKELFDDSDRVIESLSQNRARQARQAASEAAAEPEPPLQNETSPSAEDSAAASTAKQRRNKKKKEKRKAAKKLAVEKGGEAQEMQPN
uniref:UBC core domain-containing protein n=1 Tax=Octactis speculum TaxID=3111310 RepID=A0A7S2C5H6_9STRA